MCLEIVQSADKNEDHFLIQIGNVVPDAEEDGTQLSRYGYRILGIQLHILFARALCDEIPVDDFRVDKAGELDQ